MGNPPLFLVQKVDKVCSLLEHTCAILSSFKILVIFKNTSADFVLISADVLLKMIIILKELRIIAQICSYNKRTLDSEMFYMIILKSDHFKNTVTRFSVLSKL